jgi:hypothetical protein
VFTDSLSFLTEFLPPESIEIGSYSYRFAALKDYLRLWFEASRVVVSAHFEEVLDILSCSTVIPLLGSRVLN